MFERSQMKYHQNMSTEQSWAVETREKRSNERSWANVIDLKDWEFNRGGCGWGVRVVVLQPVGGQFDPQSSQICMPYDCVCDWVNVKLYCKAFRVVIKTRKALYKYKSIYHNTTDLQDSILENISTHTDTVAALDVQY